MPARTPEEVNRLLLDAMNAGDLDALVALYEPQATLSPQPGTFVTGAAAIRAALGAFVAAKPKMALTSKTIAQSGDIAMTSGRWELKGTGPDGKPMAMAGQSVEVVRRQADGTWRYVIDNPWGLG